MDGLLNLLPLQVRTLLQASSGDRSDITEKTLDAAERKRVADAILASRTYKKGLLELQGENKLNDQQAKEYKKYFPTPEIVPPVPTPTIKWVILPSVCSQISGPVCS